MPYESNASLPAGVRRAYSEACQTVFRRAFNAAWKTYEGDEARTFATAHVAARRCMSGKALAPLKATVLDDDAFRVLAIPYGGPIPSPHFPRGVDLDGETFTERTDIKPSWFDIRLVDWHHGADPVMGRTMLGKAGELEQDEDGWWVTVWLRHGERRLDLIRRLAANGAQIFGSSESVPGMVAKAATGEILVWPYIRQTLSTSPQNTFSVVRPLKATIADMSDQGIAPSDGFWTDIEAAMRNLGADLRSTWGIPGDDQGKAGRVLSGANESALREALSRFEEALAYMRDVLARQPDYRQENDA